MRLGFYTALSAGAAACVPTPPAAPTATTTPVTPLPWPTARTPTPFRPGPADTPTAVPSQTPVPTQTASPTTEPSPTVTPTATAAPQLAGNLWPVGVDLASSSLKDNPPLARKDLQTSETWNGITLHRLTGRDFYARLTTSLGEMQPPLFEAGRDYLLSFVVRSAGDERVFFWMRPMTGSNDYGHAPKLATNEARRVWQVVRATAPDRLGLISDPLLPPERQARDSLFWFFQGNSNPGWRVDLRLGGFAIQPLENAARHAVAVMGDSTTEGYSVGIDHPLSREWTTWAAALLNTPFYNRAHSGWTTGRMRAAWDERITPLAPLCRYCIIQGGLNDVALDVSLVEMMDNFTWMWQKAEQQGMIPLVTTATPYNVIVRVGREHVRQALNDWLRLTFPRVLDFDAVVRDPNNPASLRPEPGWIGDGGHYEYAAKRAVGEYVAAWADWDLPGVQ